MFENYENSPIWVNFLSICYIYLFVYKKLLKILGFLGKLPGATITELFYRF